MSALLLRWRFFWSRRSRIRIMGAILCIFAAVLIASYIVLPPDVQRRVTDALSAFAGDIGSLGSQTALGIGAAILLLLSFVLVFAPGYRRHSYLATSPSLIPPVSVYLDAENQLSDQTVGAFAKFLIGYLNGRRADLLYFLDASITANGSKFKRLYRFGFRPIHVPHNPTGSGVVKEAVDKELAMHAYERALLGPPNQEFIIVTGDGDFVHLVYRLVALGHRVRIWAKPIRQPYRTLATYLDVNEDIFNVLDLSHILPSRPVVEAPATEAPAVDGEDEAPAADNEEEIYRTIRDMLRRLDKVAEKPRLSELNKRSAFRSYLGGEFSPRLAQVGYSAGNFLDFWIEHLEALNILVDAGPRALPDRGTAEPVDAAHQLYLMAKAASDAIARTADSRTDGQVRMDEVAKELAAESPTSSEDEVTLLRSFVRKSGARGATHTRYFCRCARALGLTQFDDVPGSLDTIQVPPKVDSVNGANQPTE